MWQNITEYHNTSEKNLKQREDDNCGNHQNATQCWIFVEGRLHGWKDNYYSVGNDLEVQEQHNEKKVKTEKTFSLMMISTR